MYKSRNKRSKGKAARVGMVSNGGCTVVPTTVRKKPMVGEKKEGGNKELEKR
jgi:hypothetical protein